MKLHLRQKDSSIKLPKDIVIPNHVALICDGNRRWARARGLSTLQGHRKGMDRIEEIGRALRSFGVHTFTAWCFSTENWDRDKGEIAHLMRLAEKIVGENLKTAKKEGVRIIHLGRKDRIPARLAQKIARAEEETKNNKNYVFNFAFDYGGKDEIVRTFKRLVHAYINKFASGEMTLEDVDEKLVASYLDTSDQPYPYVDLLIRTSAEQRTSGYLPWQTAYAEVWWEEAHLPDFTKERLGEVLLDYSRRERRFGGNDNNDIKFNFVPRLVAKFDFQWRRAMELQEKGEFKDAFVKYLREQFGISLGIAKDATEIFLKALILGETEGDWKGTKRILTRFYTLIKNNVKLAFEPSLLAHFEIEYLKGSNGDKRQKVELHEILTNFYAELFRIPLLQAEKVAHFRVLAQQQEEEAKLATGKNKSRLLQNAEDYLIRSYETLKERIA